MTSLGTITVSQKTDTSESEENFALKTHLTEIKTTQTTVTHNKHRRDGVSNDDSVTCEKCGRNHLVTCWFEDEQKREDDFALLKETDEILVPKKNKKTRQ